MQGLPYVIPIICVFSVCCTCRFLLHLVCGSGSAAQLEMIETNPFKHLTHLSLKLVAGSDAALKKHLAQCVKTLKVSIPSLMISLLSLKFSSKTTIRRRSILRYT